MRYKMFLAIIKCFDHTVLKFFKFILINMTKVGDITIAKWSIVSRKESYNLSF